MIMDFVIVLITIVIAAFKSGLIRLLNENSLTRIREVLTSFLHHTIDWENLKSLLRYEIRFDFHQSCLIRFFLILLVLNLLILLMNHMFGKLGRTGKTRLSKLAMRVRTAFEMLHTYAENASAFMRSVQSCLARIGAVLKNLFPRLQLFVSTGILPAGSFRRNIALQIRHNDVVYYGGVCGFRNRSPVVRLSKQKFWEAGGDRFSPEKFSGTLAAGKNGVWLFFGNDVETNEGFCSKIFIRNGTEKKVNIGNMELYCSVSQFSNYDDSNEYRMSTVRIHDP